MTTIFPKAPGTGVVRRSGPPAEVEVLEVRSDKPIAKLRTTITNQDETVVLDGDALVWIEPL